MLVNIHHDSTREHNRLLVAGVAFLTVIALLIALLDRDLPEDLRAQTPRSPSRPTGPASSSPSSATSGSTARWSARSATIEQNGEKAVITVALEPEAADEIPDNVDGARSCPTTLFGQKFISFVHARRPVARRRWRTATSSRQDRVDTNVELSRILADLFPLLRAVRPADLNMTLNALSTALEGRGEQLGETLDDLDAYLGEIDEHLPTLREDLVKLADVADTYDLAAPDLLGVLRNLTVTSRTVVEQARRPRRLLLRPQRPGRRPRPGCSRDNEAQPDPGRRGHRAAAQAAGGLLARVPLPAQGRRRATRPILATDLRGQRDQAVHRVRHHPVQRLRRRRPARRTARSGTARGATGCPNPPIPAGPIDLDEGIEPST